MKAGAGPSTPAIIENYAIRHGLDPEKLLFKTDLARVLQMLHVDIARTGVTLNWLWYPSPDADLVKRFEEAEQQHTPSWDQLEPEFK